MDGSATVRRNGKKVATLGPGSVVGELSLLDHGPRTATVTADTEATVLVLDQRHFLGVLDERAVALPQAPGVAGRPHPRLRPPVLRLSQQSAGRPVGGPLGASVVAAMSTAPSSRTERRPHRARARPPASPRPRPRRRCSPPFTVVSGICRCHRSWHDDSAVTREVFGGVPGAAPGRLLHPHPGAARLRRVRLRRSGARTGSGAAPTAAAPRRGTPSAAWPTSAPASTCARCCAIPPPASCTR